MIFLGLKFLAKSNIFGFMKDAGIFLGHEKKTQGFFWVVKKGLTKENLFGYAKKSSNFFWVDKF